MMYDKVYNVCMLRLNAVFLASGLSDINTSSCNASLV